jgi:hypothetical protein
MDVGEEHSWQDMQLCGLEGYKAADTFSTILVPGYKFKHFRGPGYSNLQQHRETLSGY